MPSKRMNKSSDGVSELQIAVDPFDDSMLDDPDDAVELVREGIADYERGEYIELRTDAELKTYLDGIKERGRMELEAELRQPGKVRS